MQPPAARAEASRRSADALHGIPLIETSMFRMLREARCNRIVIVCGWPLRTLENKTPPGTDRGRSRCLGEIGVTDLPQEDQSYRTVSSRSHGARTKPQQPMGRSAMCFAMWAKDFMA